MAIYLPEPKSATEAALQARIAERAAHLWEEGYSWQRIEGPASGPWYKVSTPQGDDYCVDPLRNFACSCLFGANNDYCKHGIAVAAVDEELEFLAAYERNGGDDVYAA